MIAPAVAPGTLMKNARWKVHIPPGFVAADPSRNRRADHNYCLIFEQAFTIVRVLLTIKWLYEFLAVAAMERDASNSRIGTIVATGIRRARKAPHVSRN
jgi:hypothetical protein